MKSEILSLRTTAGRRLSPIVILNGPPGSGKDEAFRQIESVLSSIHFATSESLKLGALGALGLIEMDKQIEDYEAIKSQTHEDFNGHTPRAFYIKFAETMKEAFGSDFWTVTLIRKIKAMDKVMSGNAQRAVYFVTGMGFPVELKLFENDPALNKRTLLVRVKREGKDFGKKPGFEDAYGDGTGMDSRNWLFSDVLPSIEIDNNLSINDYRHDLLVSFNSVFNVSKYALDRNDTAINTALLSGRLRNNPTTPLVPFGKPYREFMPSELAPSAA